uniref:NADH-ubiquinone oxidoreductase chain 2 n=1 Tax=Tenebrionoidea sp. 22 KM-2017 TaxID=2219478 RepID=A0A346RKK4_9CUCU|nr:NADH dehydrogenase subunit 2 [Tenebrionoidea sp. 22 KM-2017]
MLFYKILFFNLMIMGTLISISSYSWFSMWMGLEINLLSIIPLMSSTKNMYSSESAMKYFISQTMASLILLFSIISMFLMTQYFNLNTNLIFILNSSLFMKLGAAPLHFWFPEVMEGLNWLNCLILLTWQKIAPSILILNNSYNLKLFMFFIIMSLIISMMMSFNQTSLRKIMAFSSINHISWMLSTMLISYTMWMIYMLIYFIITISIVMIFYNSNSYYIKQLMLSYYPMEKIFLYMNMLSLAGLPPFIGFLPKWLLINTLINQQFYMLTMMLILMTLFLIYIYIRIMIFSMLFNISNIKLMNNSMKNSILILFFCLSIHLTILMFNIF